MSIRMSRRTGQAGLSLVELMVAMTLGCFLILGITELFISFIRNGQMAKAQMENQATANFYLQRIESTVRWAGYVPAEDPTRLNDHGSYFAERAFEPLAELFPASTGACAMAAGSYLEVSEGGKVLCLRHYLPSLGSDAKWSDTQPAQGVLSCADVILFGPLSGSLASKELWSTRIAQAQGNLSCSIQLENDEHGSSYASQAKLPGHIESLHFRIERESLRVDLVVSSSQDNLLDDNCEYPDPDSPSQMLSTGNRRLCQSFSRLIYMGKPYDS